MASQDFPQSTLDKINAVNTWIVDPLIPSDPALDACLVSNAAASIEAIDVASNEGKMLYLFAKLTSSKRVLEINNTAYLNFALKFAKKGALIVVDNVVMEGRVLDEKGEVDSNGVRDLFAHLKGDKRVECTALQTIGPKGWDGFIVATVG